MPHLLDTLDDLFGTRDLYQVLEITKDANPAQIKKAYHKVSLKVHPDRAEPTDRDAATKKFQALSATYKILADPDAKALYDESGEIDDENDPILSDPNRDWSDYWRLLFPKLTVEDIQNFEKKYRDSEEELSDLKTAYIDGEGDMDYILDRVMCSTFDDVERFSKIIRGWIKEGSVDDFPKFSKESEKSKDKRKRFRAAEAAEAEEEAKKCGVTDSDSLANVIMQRKAQREKEHDNFLDNLMAKYAKPPKEGKKKKK